MRRRFAGMARDRGAVAVVVALCLVVILGAAALAIDAGSLWSTRRAMVSATDSAALAAAGRLVNASCDSTGAQTQAANHLATNEPSSTLDSFQFTPYRGVCTTGAGKVTVVGSMPAQLTVAPALGISSVSAEARSTAEY